MRRFIFWGLCAFILALLLASDQPRQAKENAYAIYLYKAEILPFKKNGKAWDHGKDRSRFPDVTISLEVAGKRLSGIECKDTLSPQWNVFKKFRLSGKEKLTIRVQDRDPRKDELIGTKSLYLHQLQFNKKISLSFGYVRRLDLRIVRLATAPPVRRKIPMKSRVSAPRTSATVRRKVSGVKNRLPSREIVKRNVSRRKSINAGVQPPYRGIPGVRLFAKRPKVTKPPAKRRIALVGRPTPPPGKRIPPTHAEEAIPVRRSPSHVKKAPERRAFKQADTTPERRGAKPPQTRGKNGKKPHKRVLSGRKVVPARRAVVRLLPRPRPRKRAVEPKPIRRRLLPIRRRVAPSRHPESIEDFCPKALLKQRTTKRLAWFAVQERFIPLEHRWNRSYKIKDLRIISKVQSKRVGYGRSRRQRIKVAVCHQITRRKQSRCYVQEMSLERIRPNGNYWGTWQVRRAYSKKRTPCARLAPKVKRAPSFERRMERLRKRYKQLRGRLSQGLCPVSTYTNQKMLKKLEAATYEHYEKTELRKKELYQFHGIHIRIPFSIERVNRGRALQAKVGGYICSRVRTRKKKTVCKIDHVQFARRQPDGSVWQDWHLIKVFSSKKVPCDKWKRTSTKIKKYNKAFERFRNLARGPARRMEKGLCPWATHPNPEMASRAWRVTLRDFESRERRRKVFYDLRGVRVRGKLLRQRIHFGSTLQESIGGYICYRKTYRKKHFCKIQFVTFARTRPDGAPWQSWELSRYGRSKTVSCNGLPPASARPKKYMQFMNTLRIQNRQIEQAISEKRCPPSTQLDPKLYKKVWTATHLHFLKRAKKKREVYNLYCVRITGKVKTRRVRRGRVLQQALQVFNGHLRTWRRGRIKHCFIQRTVLKRYLKNKTTWSDWRVTSYTGYSRRYRTDCAKLSRDRVPL